jgi:hypothetical protein
MCVETRPVSICLGRHADERIARPGTDLSRDELAQALEEDPKLMHIFKSCFSQNAKVDMASAELGFVDIRTGRYTCELRRRAGVWRVVSFYDSLGGC